MAQHSERRLQHIASTEVDGSPYTDFAADNTFANRAEDKQTNKQTAQKLTAQKKSQAIHYNRGTKSLAPPRIGETIRMRLPDERNWSMGRCVRILCNRSYEVEVNGSQYRRNRRQLRSTAEPLDAPTHTDDIDEPPHEINVPDQVPQRTDHTETPTPPVPRRSVRSRQPPKWQNDYEL